MQCACGTAPCNCWDPSTIIHHPSSIIHHPSSTIHHPSSIFHHDKAYWVGQTHTHTDRQTYQCHDSNRTKGRAEWKLNQQSWQTHITHDDFIVRRIILNESSQFIFFITHPKSDIIQDTSLRPKGHESKMQSWNFTRHITHHTSNIHRPIKVFLGCESGAAGLL